MVNSNSPDDYEEQWDTIEKKLAYYNVYEGFWESFGFIERSRYMRLSK